MEQNLKPQNEFIESIKKWKRIIRKRHAFVGTDGQINPREEDISDNHVYFFVHGGPIKIFLLARAFKKINH